MSAVLMFNISPRKADEIRILSIRLNFSCREIAPSEQHLRVCDLLGGSCGTSVPAVKPFSDEMLIMDGFSHPDLNFFLNELIRTGNQISLKAVVTPTNRDWSASFLCSQLIAENREMRSRKKSV